MQRLLVLIVILRGKNTMNINDLNLFDWIKFKIKGEKIERIGQVKDFSVGNVVRASVELENTGTCLLLEDSFLSSIEKLELPTTRKIEHKDEDGPDFKNMRQTPNHYKGTSDIDLIEFFYQQWGLEALKAVTSFNIQRYALRLGRKDKETNELWKIIDYAQRYIEKKEKENG